MEVFSFTDLVWHRVEKSIKVEAVGCKHVLLSVRECRFCLNHRIHTYATLKALRAIAYRPCVPPHTKVCKLQGPVCHLIAQFFSCTDLVWQCVEQGTKNQFKVKT